MICLLGRSMWKPPCFSCGKVDSRRGCGNFSGKWSCVFADGEMDKFPQIGGDGDNAGEFENEGFVGEKIQSGKNLTIWQNPYSAIIPIVV